MPLLRIGRVTRDIDLVVFDKDGTLVDFDRLWAGKLIGAVNSVVAAFPETPHLRGPLLSTLGVDPGSMRVIPESPLAVSTLAKLGVACSVVLHQNGVAWHAAETVTRDLFMPAIEALPGPDETRAIGDVSGLFRTLTAAGFRCAIFTSDDRDATLATTALLGLEGHVAAMVCGDDPIPGKPAGDGLLHLSRHCAVAAERILMVGDSVSDMRAAAAAGAGFKLAVLSGTGREADLRGHADAVEADVHVLGIT